MPAGRRHRPFVPLVQIALAIVLMATLFAAPVGASGATPTVRLFVSQSQITVERNRRDFVSIDPGAWITPVTDDFELWVSRPDYDTPVTIKQVDSDTKAVLRTFPAEAMDSWAGLKDFAHYEVRDATGEVVAGDTFSFCPNGYVRQRLSDDSPLNPSYPYFCNGGPFTKGSIWGIDDGWAAAIIGDYYYGLGWKAERRHYTLTFWIDPAWVDLLDISAVDASAQVHVTAVDRGTLAAQHGTVQPAVPRAVPKATPYPKTPIVTTPDPQSLPDLVALPGWGMSTYTRHGHDYLAFNSTEWNAGPGTMVVEGFRGPDESTMDAFQYFLADGQPVGKAPIGQLEYHAGGGHNHWHFEEFTQYSLLNGAQQRVVVSGKQSWCLVNTDALDLTLPNANLLGYGQDLGTSCGGPGALWIREVLDVGWGDTYGQYVAGQAFDITGLPNGAYYVRVHVNPLGAMYESNMANNVEDRLIRLRGKPGHRRVFVPPWHGIDTENYCPYCG
jgi:Lysyl oxidase